MPLLAPIEVTVDGLRLSGRVAEPDTAPHAVLFALHGGSYSSRYYDLRTASALRTYAGLGYRAVALDRPGYGAATGVAPAASAFPAQSATLRAAVDALHRERGDGLPVFLIGHSIGGMIAMTMAADGLEAPLRGVMASGMGMVWQPGIREMWSSLLGDAPAVPVPNEARDEIMFAADPELVDPAVQREAASDLHPIPTEELRCAVRWHETMPAVAAGIRVPLLHVLPELDGIWRADGPARQRAVDALAAVGGAEVTVARGVGHCLDLHRGGYAHHLATAAHFESCLLTA